MEKVQNWKADADACLRQGDISAAIEEMKKALEKEKAWEREPAFVSRLIDIYWEERRAGETHTVFDGVKNVDEAVGHFVWTKLLLRRLEFGLPKEYWQELYGYCAERQVSATMLHSVLCVNIIQQEETCRRLISLYEENEGKQSERAHYFGRLLQELDEAGKQDDE